MKYHFFLGLIVYIAFNAALVFSSAFIVTQFAPAAAGSGIPEIKAYLNGTSHLFVFFLFFFK
jgi:chloride channel 7